MHCRYILSQWYQVTWEMRYCFDDFFILSAFNWIGVHLLGVHNLDNQHVILTINTLLNRSPNEHEASYDVAPETPSLDMLGTIGLASTAPHHFGAIAYITVWILRPMCVHMLLGRSFCSQLFFCLVPMDLCFFFLWWSFKWNFFRLLFLRYWFWVFWFWWRLPFLIGCSVWSCWCIPIRLCAVINLLDCVSQTFQQVLWNFLWPLFVIEIWCPTVHLELNYLSIWPDQ